MLSNVPDIVVSTPARAWQSVTKSGLALDKLEYLVLDEADLILSYGYDKDMENISREIPKGVQTTMMSATLTEELGSLKSIFSRTPKLLDLNEEIGEDDEKLRQFYVKCAEDDKWLLAYLIFKLQLIKGKSLIFVADIDRSYRLKVRCLFVLSWACGLTLSQLFFEQFSIRSCILNSELPINSRIKVIEDFNKGIYDIIIASDEKSEMFGDEAAEGEKKKESEEGSKPKEAGKETSEKEGTPSKKKRKTSKKDQEYGVSRGNTAAHGRSPCMLTLWHRNRFQESRSGRQL